MRPVSRDLRDLSGLKEHADDGHHRQSAVGELRRELLGFLSRVRGRQHLEAEVTRRSRSASRLVLRHLAEGHVCQDLCPPCRGHFRDGSQAVGNIRELQSCRWAQVARQLSSDPRSHNFLLPCLNVCKHANNNWPTASCHSRTPARCKRLK